jgi:hypothetical protein
LQVESILPERVQLPITETGYRSHFTPPATVAANRRIGLQLLLFGQIADAQCTQLGLQKRFELARMRLLLLDVPRCLLHETPAPLRAFYDQFSRPRFWHFFCCI